MEAYMEAIIRLGAEHGASKQEILDLEWGFLGGSNVRDATGDRIVSANGNETAF
jgi:hypothetical protein